MRLFFATLSAVLVFSVSSEIPTTNVVATGFVAVTTGSGTLQISSFKLDGSSERRLTKGPANHHYPSVSPDGTQILYTGDEGGLDEVYRLDLVHPALPVRITSPPLTANGASWSPDGGSIVYSALVHGSAAYQIFVSDSDGANPRQLTHTPDSGNTQPVFSPDGARIAYISGREESQAGSNRATVSGMANRIWVVAGDGSGANPVTPGPLDAYPAWLDASTILFARSSFLSQSSNVIAAHLDGREQVLSPPNQYLVEPRPLSDGRTYGATMENGRALHVVRISRTDRSALTTQSASTYVIDRIPIPAADGNSFTMAWILARAPAGDQAQPKLLAVLVFAAAGGFVLLLAWLTSSRLRRTNYFPRRAVDKRSLVGTMCPIRRPWGHSTPDCSGRCSRLGKLTLAC